MPSMTMKKRCDMLPSDIEEEVSYVSTHSNVIRFDHRPFADRDEMDHVLIELWNGRVQPDDTVYIVGDYCYRSDHAPEWYLRQLKGHKFLVLGYHDLPILDNPKALH